jgi:hypothetical protein
MVHWIGAQNIIQKSKKAIKDKERKKLLKAYSMPRN